MRSSNVLALFLIWAALGGNVPEARAQTWIDLSVESAQVNTPRLAENQKVEIVAAIRNNGSQAAKDVHIEIEILKKGKRIRALNAIPVLSHLPSSGVGQCIPISLGIFAPGSYDAVVKVDPDNLILETDESNNVRTVTFNVSKPIA